MVFGYLQADSPDAVSIRNYFSQWDSLSFSLRNHPTEGAASISDELPPANSLGIPERTYVFQCDAILSRRDTLVTSFNAEGRHTVFFQDRETAGADTLSWGFREFPTRDDAYVFVRDVLGVEKLADSRRRNIFLTAQLTDERPVVVLRNAVFFRPGTAYEVSKVLIPLGSEKPEPVELLPNMVNMLSSYPVLVQMALIGDMISDLADVNSFSDASQTEIAATQYGFSHQVMVLLDDGKAELIGGSYDPEEGHWVDAPSIELVDYPGVFINWLDS